ncbi:MAG: hypothetical protein ACYSSI_13425, partial [Planctomycetota bacterium]
MRKIRKDYNLRAIIAIFVVIVFLSNVIFVDMALADQGDLYLRVPFTTKETFETRLLRVAKEFSGGETAFALTAQRDLNTDDPLIKYAGATEVIVKEEPFVIVAGAVAEKEETASYIDGGEVKQFYSSLATAKQIKAYYTDKGRHKTIPVHGVDVPVADNIGGTGVKLEEIQRMLEAEFLPIEMMALSDKLLIVAADKLAHAVLGGDCVGNGLVLLNKGLRLIKDPTARIIMVRVTLRHEIRKHELTGQGREAHSEESDRDDINYILQLLEKSGLGLSWFIEKIRPTLSKSALFENLMVALKKPIIENIVSAIFFAEAEKEKDFEAVRGENYDRLTGVIDGEGTIVTWGNDIEKYHKNTQDRLNGGKYFLFELRVINRKRFRTT